MHKHYPVTHRPLLASAACAQKTKESSLSCRPPSLGLDSGCSDCASCRTRQLVYERYKVRAWKEHVVSRASLCCNYSISPLNLTDRLSVSQPTHIFTFTLSLSNFATLPGTSLSVQSAAKVWVSAKGEITLLTRQDEFKYLFTNQ